MSKITEALKRAESDRAVKRQGEPNGGIVRGYFQAIKEELRDEFRWVQQAMVSKATPPSPGPVGEPVRAGELATLGLERALQACAREAARRAEERSRLTAQSAALDERLAQVEQECLAMRRRLAHAAEATAALEAAQASLRRETATWRGCQTLLRNLREAGEACEAQAALVAQAAQSAPTDDNLAGYYQRVSDTVQQYADGLKARLAQVLAAAAATDAPAGHKEGSE